MIAPLQVNGEPRNPYSFIWGDRDWLYQCDLEDPEYDFDLFEKCGDGFRHYACLRLKMPATDILAVVSLARFEGPVPG